MSVQVSTLMVLDSHKMEVRVKNEALDEIWTLEISDVPEGKMFPQAEYRFWLFRSQLEQIVQTIEGALGNE